MVNSNETIQVLLCSVHLSGKHMLFFAAINYVLSITATLGNTVILFALNKESSLHPPSKLLYRCLAFTDLFVGIISQPVVAVYFTLVVITENYWLDLCVYVASTGALTFTILSAVSMLTMSAISVDRLLALSLGLRYRHVVTLKRVRVLVLCFWIPSVAFTVIMMRKILPTLKNVQLCFIFIMPFGLSQLLFENRLRSATSSRCHTRSSSPRSAQWRNSTEQATVQKDRIYSNVHFVDVNSMLSALLYSFSDSYDKWFLPVSSCNLGIYNNSCLF